MKGKKKTIRNAMMKDNLFINNFRKTSRIYAGAPIVGDIKNLNPLSLKTARNNRDYLRNLLSSNIQILNLSVNII